MHIYSLYGLNVECDFSFPFLTPLNQTRNIELTIKHKPNLKFNHKIRSQETISNLSISNANIENKYYKCIITNGSLIEYKFKKKESNISLLMNFLHMPFAFAMFQKGYLPIHGMSFLHDKKTIIMAGMSGSGKSSLSSILSKTHQIRSEDITCVTCKDHKMYSMPSFPITLSEAGYSKHLKKFSSEKISRKRNINYLNDKYDNKKLVEVDKLYILEWGDCEEIKKLDDDEALKKLLISSFKPYPFNSCITSEKKIFKNIMGLIRNNKIYLYTRKKNVNISSHVNILKHIENDSS